MRTVLKVAISKMILGTALAGCASTASHRADDCTNVPGAVIGGVAGGVAGSQFGSGRGYRRGGWQ